MAEGPIWKVSPVLSLAGHHYIENSVVIPAVLLAGVFSKILTSQPLRQSSRAATRPPTPAPDMRAETPFGALRMTVVGCIFEV